MNISEPIVVGGDRYRLHRVRSGLHVCWQVEWQEAFKTLKRHRMVTRDGEFLEFLSPPDWESTARLFATAEEAVTFVTRVLSGAAVDGPPTSRHGSRPVPALA